MIDQNNIAPGMTVLCGGEPTTVLTGHYEDQELGWMIKTSKYPGGMPLSKYDPMPAVTEETDTPNSSAEVIAAERPVSFELAIIDEPTPVKITAALIREKSKALTDLTIANIFDEAGYKKVKAAVQKAVKTRTSIEKKEKEVVDAMKLRHASEKKEVTDYTSELYVACREAQTALEGKLKVIDDLKTAAAKKLEDEEKERTTGRDDKMYELGMTFNGQAFVGYGKAITKNSLYSLDNDSFEGIVVELEGLAIEQGITGDVKPEPVQTPTASYRASNGDPSFESASAPAKQTPIAQEKRFANQVYTCSAGDYSFHLTQGQVQIVDGQVIINERVMTSAIYAQVIFNGI